MKGSIEGKRTFQTQDLQKPDGGEVRDGRGRDKAAISGKPSWEELYVPKKDVRFILQGTGESGKLDRQSFATHFLFLFLLLSFPSFWRPGTKSSKSQISTLLVGKEARRDLEGTSAQWAPFSCPRPQMYKAELE